MEITRDVILDLLPLYMAGEVSADTRALVEKYLESDPKLAEIARQSATTELLAEIPVPLTEEDKMQAYKKTKLWILLYIVIAAFFITVVLGVMLAAFLISV